MSYPTNKIFKLLFLLCISILTSSTILIGQSRGLKSIQVSSIDFVLGGDFGFRLISGKSSNSEVIQEIYNREQFEKSKLNYRFGINYYQGITGSLLIKTGVRIANPGFSISSINTIDIDKNINTIEKSYLFGGSEYRYNYQIVELPVGLKYVISGSVCNPHIEFGVSTNIYWRTIVEERFYEGGSNNKIITEEINKVNFIGFLAVGGDFTISDYVSGFSQLVVRYQLNNLRTSELTERIISLGLELGLKFYL